MADVTVPDKSIHEKTTLDQHPQVTTPQGTQENGVERGHEHRDVDFRKLFGWMFALAIIVVLTIVGVRGMFGLMASIMTRHDVVPSPLFAASQDPPRPRLLPSPVDIRAHPNEPFPVPGDYLIQDRQDEDVKLKRFGLEDPSGSPALPPGALTAVAKGGPPASAAPPQGAPAGEGSRLKQLMPSESSGGTNTENWLP